MRLTSLLFLTLVGCGSEMTREQAGQGFAALNQAMGTSSQGLTNTDSIGIACPEGGTMSFVYSMSQPTNDVFSLDFTTAFDACAANDVTMDGTLRYAAESSSEGNEFWVSYFYQGAIDFSGACEGSCDIDMRSIFSSSGVLTYEGTFCGYDVAELVEDT